MFPDNTHVVREIDQEDLYHLYHEVVNAVIWKPHSENLKNTALKEGFSCHVHWVLDDDNLTVNLDNRKKFPKTMEVIKKLFPKKKFGRIYWHRLLPQNKIDLHTDAALKFVKNNLIESRFQIYLDIPEDFILMFEGGRVNHKIFQNSLVNFNLRAPHFYKNNSNQNVYFLVFDVI